MVFPLKLEYDSAEAGLPSSFCWQGAPTVDESGHVQVLEQAQSSRWSLSTAGTPLEGFFPSNLRSLSRTRPNISTPDLRAKSLYGETGRKKSILTKPRRDDHLLPSTNGFQPLRVTIGMDEDADLLSPSRSTESSECLTPASTTVTLVETEKGQRWKRRKTSLGKIVNYPSKILGMILPRRDDSPKESSTPMLKSTPPTSFYRRGNVPKGSVTPPPQSSPPTTLSQMPQPPLRRAETTIRRPKRSSELQRPDESTKRWSVASTQAIRAERFSQSIDRRPMDLKKIANPILPPGSLPSDHPPLPALTRSQTQPVQRSRRDISPNKKPRLPKRNHSERHNPRSPMVASTETISTIADRIAARELDKHDSWDFLDYYAQSGRLGGHSTAKNA